VPGEPASTADNRCFTALSDRCRLLRLFPVRNAYMFGGCTEVRVSIGSQLFVMVGSVYFCASAKLGCIKS
jgi:hypothetical protein